MPESLQLRDKDGSLHEVNVSTSATNSAEIQESSSSESAGHGKHGHKGEVACTFTHSLTCIYK